MKYSPSVLLPKVIRRLRRYKQRALALRKKYIRRPPVFEEGYSMADTTLVTLYASSADAFPGYQPRVNLAQAQKQRKVQVSLVATVRNEGGNVEAWGESLLQQTRLPDEVVITDAGSTDGTVDLLKKLAARSPFPILVLSEPGANIARGRNLAIAQARHEVIATSDFGCRLRPDWLEKLVAPFEIDPQTEVVAGMYHVVEPPGSRGFRNPWWSDKAKIDPATFLPSGRSAAFTRAAWQSASGYPEWLSLTGEDTYFDLELKRTARWWAFSPEALVDWEAPATMMAYWKKLYRWSIGDGETGMLGSAYWYAAIVSTLTLLGLGGGLLLMLLGALFTSLPLALAGALLLLLVIARAAFSGRRAGYTAAEVVLVTGILAAQAAGYLRGAARRVEVTRRRLKCAKGLHFILAVIPIDDTGGGARSTQIALELLRRQNIVVYINKYPKDESVDLRLEIRHPNLFTIPADRFNLQDFCAKYEIDLARYETSALVEMPHKGWLPLIDSLQRQGTKIIYDLIDEWDSHLGQLWYKKEVEEVVVQKADVLVATAPVLKQHLENMAHRSVCLLPNAVNLGLFNRRKRYPAPADLPQGKPIITYIGALYGSWFDWDLLVATARAYPDSVVMVIGDYRGQCPVALPNLHFLGLKPQASLPAYLAHADVAIIPWKVNEITLATSPLKLYEFLAMHVPVVIPDLPLLRGIPAVYPSADAQAFVKNIQAAARDAQDEAAVDEFVRQNCWEARVEELMRLVK